MGPDARHVETEILTEGVLDDLFQVVETNVIPPDTDKDKTPPERKKKKKEHKKEKDPIKIDREEVAAMKKLKKRVSDGELIICQTDKSSRFSVLSRKQYLDSGKQHTEKDKKITWKEAKYIQGQLNSHL